MKSLTLKCNPLIPMASNFTFTNTKNRSKLQKYGNTKLALLPLLPTLCVHQNVYWSQFNCVKEADNTAGVQGGFWWRFLHHSTSEVGTASLISQHKLNCHVPAVHRKLQPESKKNCDTSRLLEMKVLTQFDAPTLTVIYACGMRGDCSADLWGSSEGARTSEKSMSSADLEELLTRTSKELIKGLRTSEASMKENADLWELSLQDVFHD